MSLPEFIVKQVSQATQTTLVTVVQVVNSLIQNLNNIFTYLKGKVQLDSVVLPNVSLTIGDNIIPHTLGRTLTGYSIVRRSVALVYFDKQTTTTYNTATYLVLNSNVATTVTLLVF